MLWQDEDDALLKHDLALSMNIPGSDSSLGDAEMSEATNGDPDLALGMSCYFVGCLNISGRILHQDT